MIDQQSSRLKWGRENVVGSVRREHGKFCRVLGETQVK